MLTYPSGSLYILMEPIVLTYGFPATDISARRFADAIDHAMFMASGELSEFDVPGRIGWFVNGRLHERKRLRW
jgi:hypothetical protein